jgi:hypothetical protein
MRTEPPSRPSSGLATYSGMPRGESRYAGSRYSWPGYSSHRTASSALLDSSSFQAGSIQVVGVPGASAGGPYGSASIHSHG